MTKSKESTVTETLSRTGDILTEKPIFVTVNLRPKNKIDKFLMHIRLKSNNRVFELRPIVVGNMIRIASKVIEIPEDIIDQQMLEVLMNGTHEHMDKLIYIVACGIQNNRKEPSTELIEFIKYEFTSTDVAKVIDNILMQMNAKDFIKSIVLIRGLNVLSVPEMVAKTVNKQDY